MSKRINIILPESTLQTLDRVAAKGNRSRFVSEAVLYYVRHRGKQSLREQLKAGYEANAKENIEIALDWFPAEEEAWQAFPADQHGKK